jgi:hypothetical protein
MREGYVYVRSRGDAGPGEVILDLAAPNLCHSSASDLSPDGSTLAIATSLKDGRGGQIHLVDVGTGAFRLVHQEPAPEASLRTTPMTSASFDASGGSLVYTVGGETRRLDLTTRTSERLAGYEEFANARFNVHVALPAWDGERRRLIVYDAGDLVRVLEETATVLEVPTASAKAECRCAALSRSGKRLVLYRASRFVLYGHEDAKDDATNQFEIWDVDTKALHKTISASWKGIDKVGFDPSENHIVFCHQFAQGPGIVSIESGKETWHQQDAFRTDRWGTCFGWAFSPGGRRSRGRRIRHHVRGHVEAREDASTSPGHEGEAAHLPDRL